ncbi:MAG: hypothetical protein K8U03_12920 [Planctomycetia bacterium]|nr:hypothetical protein [Planctomycetia bacterium]
MDLPQNGPRSTWRNARFLLLAIGWATLVGDDLAAAAKPKPLERDDLQRLVAGHLKNNPNYVSGDLITQGDVEPIFNDLIAQGKPPADNEALYDAFLPERDFLAKSLRTPEGRKFMRGVAKLPKAYDRLERLSWSTTGRRMLAELIASPDGPKMFERILSPEGTALIEESLKNDPRGANFQLPTGKVHTADELLDRLEATLITNVGRVKKQETRN